MTEFRSITNWNKGTPLRDSSPSQDQLPATHCGRDQQHGDHSDDHGTPVAARQVVQLQHDSKPHQPAHDRQPDREQHRPVALTNLVPLFVQPFADSGVGKAPLNLPPVQRAVGFEQLVRSFHSICLRSRPQARQRSAQPRGFQSRLPAKQLATYRAETARGFDLVLSIGTTSVFPYISAPVLDAYHFRKPSVEINPGQTDVTEFVTVKVPLGAATALEAIWSRYNA